jgi:2-polyprenyl-3-methyl-5-hydroxy-6-metoxy-1,4-benzoquinol methylase
MIYSNIKKCRICQSSSLKEVLDLKNQPSSNALRKKLSDKEYKIPLKLLYCQKCSTAQLSATANPKYLFNHYVWVTETSKSAKEYSNLFFKRVIKKTKKNSFIVEIASNDGTFLKPFKKSKRSVLGVDPAKNIAKIANKKGIKTIPKFFNDKCAKEIVKKNSNADIVFARNVIPHVKDIHSIVKGINTLLSKNGTAVIEFHYSKIIQDELHYDSIYHEHLFYFTLKTITNLFKKYNLHAFDVDKSPISGGSLVLYFSKTKIPLSKNLNNLVKKEKLNKINQFNSWKNFANKSKNHAKQFKIAVKKLNVKKKIIGYGASARSSTLLNFSGINSNFMSNVIDKNKLKKNKYTPGSGIKIKDYDDVIKNISKFDTIIILAWNFKKEIIEDLKKNGFQGNFLLPLPNQIKTYEN